MDAPPSGLLSTLNRMSPLDEASLLPDVDLLSAPDQPNNHAPRRHPLRELDEVLGLGLATLEPRRRAMFLP